MFNIVLIGEPIPKKRPRFSTRAGFVQTYDAQKTEKEITIMQLKQQLAQIRVLKPLESQISIEMTFHTPQPKFWSLKRKEREFGKYNPKRPDIDNYCKFYLDAMNKIVYKDDGQVVRLYAQKVYAYDPRTEISFTPI